MRLRRVSRAAATPRPGTRSWKGAQGASILGQIIDFAGQSEPIRIARVENPKRYLLLLDDFRSRNIRDLDRFIRFGRRAVDFDEALFDIQNLGDLKPPARHLEKRVQEIAFDPFLDRRPA